MGNLSSKKLRELHILTSEFKARLSMQVFKAFKTAKVIVLACHAAQSWRVPVEIGYPGELAAHLPSSLLTPWVH